MPYVILRGRWFQIIFLNIHATTEDKFDGMKENFNGKLERIVNKFAKLLYFVVFLSFSSTSAF
jgi:hypothetical protein